MTELQTSGDFGLPHIPDNLTIAQFMLDYQHEIRPARGNIPCLVDDQSGNCITLETVRSIVLFCIYHNYTLPYLSSRNGLNTLLMLCTRNITSVSGAVVIFMISLL